MRLNSPACVVETEFKMECFVDSFQRNIVIEHISFTACGDVALPEIVKYDFQNACCFWLTFRINWTFCSLPFLHQKHFSVTNSDPDFVDRRKNFISLKLPLPWFLLVGEIQYGSISNLTDLSVKWVPIRVHLNLRWTNSQYCHPKLANVSSDQGHACWTTWPAKRVMYRRGKNTTFPPPPPPPPPPPSPDYNT